MLNNIKKMLLDDVIYYFLLNRDPKTLGSKRLNVLTTWCEWYLDGNGNKPEFCKLVSQNSSMDNLMILELAGDLDKLKKRFKLMDKNRKEKEPF
jgi:hypothetical protein